MNKKNLTKKENSIINMNGVIDNIVKARNNAFILERYKDLNLAIFKAQSEYFSDEKNKDQLLNFLAELENKKNTLRTYGKLYLDNLDAPISTTFKNVANVIKNNFLDFLKDMEESLETIINGEKNEHEVINFNEAVDDLNSSIDTAVQEIVELSQSVITSFNEGLIENINLSNEILNCCTTDMEEKEINNLETNINTSLDDYTKKYLEYKNNFDILKTVTLSLENIQSGIDGILNNFKSIEDYYNSLKNLNKFKNISSSNKPAIQSAINCIRYLTESMNNTIHTLKNYTKGLYN